MDETRFDSFARALHAASPRRSTLGLLLGGALGIAGLAESAAKKKGKGKGKGKKKDKDKEKCAKAKKDCGGGRCKRGDTCCSDFDCDDCQNLWCSNRDVKVPGVCGCFSDNEIYHNGRCGHMPTCLSAGERRGFYDILCCSGSQHTEGPEEAPYDVCDPGYLSCLSDSDCIAGKCRGFTCEDSQLFCDLR